MISLTLNRDGTIEVTPRRLVMREDRLELAQIVVDHVDIPWVPDKHPRWPKNTMKGTENIGGQFMDMGFDTDSLKAYIGEALPVGETPDPSKWVDVTGLANGSKHIKQVQIFRAVGQGGDKIIVRLRLDTDIPKAPKVPQVQKSDTVKVANLAVGTKFTDASGYGWKIADVPAGHGAAGESYVAVLPVPNSELSNPVTENPWNHGLTRITGKADVHLDAPVVQKAETPVTEEDDGIPLKKFSNYSAFVTKYENFTLDKLYALLEQVDKTAVLDEGSHGFKDSPKEGNYHAFVAATKGEQAVSSSASLGEATVFARATTSNKPDKTPHDPSIIQHAQGGLTAAQWKAFGAKDQANYNRLTEKIGAWSSGKGKHEVEKVKSSVDNETSQLYGQAVQQQLQSGKSATDAGFMFDVTEGYNIYASKHPGVTKEKYLKFESMMYKIQDVAMWDLYNSVKDPNIILIHNNNFSPESTQSNMEGNQYVPGQYPFFGGVSWSTNMTGLSSFGHGGSIILMRIPIERISLYNLIQSLYSTNEAEFTIRQEMFFDPDNTIFAHRDSGWEGGPETWQKLIDTLHTTGTPRSGTHWKDVQGWFKGYVDPPMPLGEMEDGQFFRDDDDYVWNITKIDDEGVHARAYLTPGGEKVESPKEKVYAKTVEHPPVNPKVSADQLSVGEVVIDNQGNTWQHAGITEGSKVVLVPYEVSDGEDPHNWIVGETTQLKLHSLGEDVPAWVENYKAIKPKMAVGAALEGAIVLTPWGQRMQVLTPGKHGEKIKAIQLDEHDNPIANTERTLDLATTVAELKPGHPPLPPPAFGDKVKLSQMKAGDVISRNGVELKLIAGIGNDAKIIYNENTPDRLKGELASASDLLTVTFMYERKEDLPVMEVVNYPNNDESVWIDDLAVGDTFYYQKKYWQVDALKGDVVEASQPNPQISQLPQAEFPTSTKVWPSGIPQKPLKTYYGADAKHEISWDDLKVGDKVTMNNGDPMTISVVSPSGGYVRTEELGRVYADQGKTYTWHRFDPPTRPKTGDEVVAKSLWIGDVVEAADGQKLKVAKAPNSFDQPFVDLATGKPELYDANAYYTYVGRAEDLIPGKAPQKVAPLPSGVPGYDTPLADTKVGYVVQTKNGSRWRVTMAKQGLVQLQGIGTNNEPLDVHAEILMGTGDPVGVIDTGRKRLGDLEPGHAFAKEDAYGSESYAVISQTDAGTLVHPMTNTSGEAYIVNKPELQTMNSDEEVKYLGESKSHPEMAPPQTEAKSGYAKKSPQIGEVELWPPGSAVVTSGNYFYIVGASSHGQTMLTDMAGKQHHVPSKTFLVKSASNGPKPQKGVKLVASNEVVFRLPRKGEYFLYNNKMYVSLTPQVKSMTVAPVDEYGNITGDTQKITQLGSKYLNNYVGKTGVALLHVQKDNGPMPKLYHDEYTPKIVTRTDSSGIQLGDYVALSHEPDKRYLLIGKSGDVLKFAHLDKNGNATGTISDLTLGNIEQYDILERPDGLSKVVNFDVGQQLVIDNPNPGEDGTIIAQVVQKNGSYGATVVQMTGDGKGRSHSLAANSLVKANPGTPVASLKKVGELTNAWFLDVGDVITFEGGYNSFSNYGSGPQRVKVVLNDGNYLHFVRVDEAGNEQGSKWQVRRGNYSFPITLVATESSPQIYVPPTFEPVAPPTPPVPGVVKVGEQAKIRDLPVGAVLNYTPVNSSSGTVFTWEIYKIAEDGDVYVKKVNNGQNYSQKQNRRYTSAEATPNNTSNKHIDSYVNVVSLPEASIPESSFTEPKFTPKPGEKTAIGAMDVGDYFQVTQADGNGVFTWKVMKKDEDYMVLYKIGTNPDQQATLKTTSAHYGITAQQVPAEAWENQPVQQGKVTEPPPDDNVNKNSVAGIWHHLHIGSMFTHEPPPSPAYPNEQVQVWKVVSGPQSNQSGILLNIKKVGYNPTQVDTFVLRPDSFEDGVVKLYEDKADTVSPAVETPPPPVKAKAFVEAVKAEQERGTPRLEAVAKTATVMHKTLDEAIDSFPAANEPPSGAYVPMDELKVGDTYSIVESDKYKGWKWHIEGKNDDGSHNLQAVDAKDGQPFKLKSFGLTGNKKLVEKIASDDPAATLNANDLVPGDVFQIKVGGDIFTWKVITIEGDNIHLQAVGSTKNTPQQKNFKTTVTNVANQIGSGNWLPM